MEILLLKGDGQMPDLNMLWDQFKTTGSAKDYIQYRRAVEQNKKKPLKADASKKPDAEPNRFQNKFS
jgi:hypothetical protein